MVHEHCFQAQSTALFMYYILYFAPLHFCQYTMDAEGHSTSTSAIASALASGITSTAMGLVPVNSKSAGLLEAAVPMVIVQEFIEDNKEKGMPVNQKVADLKKKQEAIKAEKKLVTKKLKNKERTLSCLRARAKRLSSETLAQVLDIRATEFNLKRIKKNEADLATLGMNKDEANKQDE